MDTVRTTCSLCEACCAALMDIDGGKIIAVKPDREDPLSGGFICAKGTAIPELESDPDRIRTPLIRDHGQLRPASWEEAYSFIDQRLSPVIAQHGREAIAAYVGNGAGHSLSMQLFLPAFVEALGTKNFFTSGTVDQIPAQAVAALLFGSYLSVPVPDLDRCQLLWIIGANPAESNGSMMTAPGILGRLQKIQGRGGRIVVIDPRKTATAKRADEHLQMRPSGDAAFLAAVANVILAAGPVPSAALDLCGEMGPIKDWLAPFTPERVSGCCDIDAQTIRRLALELRATDSAALYGRMGTTTQHFSSLVIWLIQLVNILAGNLDVVGGSMFTSPLYAQDNTLGVPRLGRGKRFGRWTARASGAAEVMGELPVWCLPDEIDTPGAGQVRAMFIVGANPALSNPDAARIAAALDRLELLVCVDIYVNETSHRAHVILPGPPRLTKSNYDVWYYQFAVRHYGRFTKSYRPLAVEERSEREILLRLAAIAGGRGWNTDINADDEAMLERLVAAEIRRPGSRIQGRDVAQIMKMLHRLGPVERRLDFAFRIGPHGDAFGAADGITFETVRDCPPGLDLGPLLPRLPDILRTKSGAIELKQPFVTQELARLERWLDEERPKFVLVGRRQIRSNNSWMHNLSKLAHAGRTCVLVMNDVDAAELKMKTGDLARVATSSGQVEVTVELSEDIARGVVSLPHGWGHGSLTEFQHKASAHPGVNVNNLTFKDHRDPLTGTMQLNGYAVDVTRHAATS